MAKLSFESFIKIGIIKEAEFLFKEKIAESCPKINTRTI
jgi:hypothetical protein